MRVLKQPPRLKREGEFASFKVYDQDQLDVFSHKASMEWLRTCQFHCDEALRVLMKDEPNNFRLRENIRE